LTASPAEEEQAGLERDYERAAKKKAERLRLETDYSARRDVGSRTPDR
jgi:ATP-dependent Clp protease ATP-binding subunit ClpC